MKKIIACHIFIALSTMIYADKRSDLDRIIGAQNSFQALGKKKSSFIASSQEELAKQVRSALKNLMKQYHPDRPIEGLVERQNQAAAKINEFLDNPLMNKTSSSSEQRQKNENLKKITIDSWSNEITRWSSRLQSANISEFKTYRGNEKGGNAVAVYGKKEAGERIRDQWKAVFAEIVNKAASPEFADIKSKFVVLRDYALQLFEFSNVLFTDPQFKTSGRWSDKLKKEFDLLVQKEQKAQKLVAPGALKRIKSFFSSKSVDKEAAKMLNDFARTIFNLLRARTKALDRSRGIERIEDALGLPS